MDNLAADPARENKQVQTISAQLRCLVLDELALTTIAFVDFPHLGVYWLMFSHFCTHFACFLGVIGCHMHGHPL